MSPTRTSSRSSLRQVSSISRTSPSSRSRVSGSPWTRGSRSARTLRRLGDGIVGHLAGNAAGLRGPAREPYPRQVSSPRDLLRTVRDELRQQFLERDALIDGALIGLLA